jgi:hypothetical protein
MGQIRDLTTEQLAYVVRHYTAGWGLDPIAARLPGVGVISLKYHLSRSGIALKASGGWPKMATTLPPLFNPAEFKPPPPPPKVKKAKAPKKPPPPESLPDPRVLAWHRPIWPGWRVHGDYRG